MPGENLHQYRFLSSPIKIFICNFFPSGTNDCIEDIATLTILLVKINSIECFCTTREAELMEIFSPAKFFTHSSEIEAWRSIPVLTLNCLEQCTHYYSIVFVCIQEETCKAVIVSVFGIIMGTLASIVLIIVLIFLVTANTEANS